MDDQVAGYSGTVAGVTFVDGYPSGGSPVIGEAVRGYARRHGLHVDGGRLLVGQATRPVTAGPPEPEQPAPLVEPKRNASRQAWQDYAIAAGWPAAEVELASRDELVELFTDPESAED